MNRYTFELLKYLNCNLFKNQRDLAKKIGFSLGLVNKSINSLKDLNYLSENNQVTELGRKFLICNKPQNAIILAAGYGLRMVPINQEKPKAFLQVNGVPLIERIIEQLNEKGIFDITIVVGFIKESFDYLIDKYSVKLVYNPDYKNKNNLFSLNKAISIISNSYIIPCDVWCSMNPFSDSELDSWYMVNELSDDRSHMFINKKNELEYLSKKGGNGLIGISYVSKNDSVELSKKVKELCSNSEYDSVFWESALFNNKNISLQAKLVSSKEVVEINSYEQLRELDSFSEELNTESINIICEVFNCKNSDIVDIRTLKKGMTNRSFIFSVKSKKYIMRIPGEGTDKLINRKQESDVYREINGKKICDELYYINPENGMKISSYVENSRCCDPFNQDDLKKCMEKLRKFHDLKLKVDHEFNLFEQIDFYESLWNQSSVFSDYEKTKNNVLSLKKFIDELNPAKCLTHIDAVPDNFLFSEKGIQLIDWEYAGMQDPHVDIAMFCIYSLYDDKNLVDQLIDLYFENSCLPEVRAKIYCYISICGLLWSNWCEYKRQLGVDFGEYSMKQYRYAKDYYKIAKNQIEKIMGVEYGNY